MLVHGIDYEFVDDEDPDYMAMIIASKVGSSNRNPIWDKLDNVIDMAANSGGFLGGLEPMCESIEDYCILNGITDIPPLYKYIFDARGGFLTQSKAIHYICPSWLAFRKPQ